MDVEALLHAVSTGESRAWSRLALLLTPELRQYFGRRFDRERAKDLTQDTLAIVVRQLPGFVPRTSFRAWVYGIARNLTRDEFRADYRRDELHLALEHEPAPTTGVSTKAAWAEESAVLEEEVEQLPTHLRVVIEHDLEEEDDPSALAQREGVSRETLRTRRHRAHARLRGRLDARFTTPAPKQLCAPKRSPTPKHPVTTDQATPTKAKTPGSPQTPR